METDTKSLWKQVVAFLALTLVFTGIVFLLVLLNGRSLSALNGLASLLLMWSPGVAALITIRIFKQPVKELGWKFGKAKYLGLAYLLPVAYALPVYLIVWISTIGKMDLEVMTLSNILLTATFIVVMAVLSALGEEIGWRGFLVPRLVKLLGFQNASLLSGVIWALWHLPFILFLDYHTSTPLWFAVLCFVIMVIGGSFAYAWLRMASGSLWTAALLHAAHNAFIQNLFDPATLDGESGVTPWIIGEFGIGLAVTSILIGVIFWRMKRPWVSVGE
ncbi:MAG: type II CAAX endopeptidase family protein [Anaerolineae bacterium]|jgi:membrane protease YdiL (CAAX protease family)|nr:type II CAAX endopeptidase family protein [Anaerolineae bacterium]